MILKALGNRARVSSRIDLKRMSNAVDIQHVVKLAGIHAQSVLIANVDRDAAVTAQTANVLINERERRIGGPLCKNVLLDHAILDRQVKIEMNNSKSPVVTELEYIEPLCLVFESGSTTIIS